MSLTYDFSFSLLKNKHVFKTLKTNEFHKNETKTWTVYK